MRFAPAFVWCVSSTILSVSCGEPGLVGIADVYPIDVSGSFDGGDASVSGDGFVRSDGAGSDQGGGDAGRDSDLDDGATGPSVRGIGTSQDSERPADAHPTEIIMAGEYAIVANSNHGLAVFDLVERGDFPLVFGQEGTDPLGPRCTTAAVHWPSDTLFCGTDSSRSVQPIAAIDVSDVSRPRVRQNRAIPNLQLAVADIEVLGDRLFLSRFANGLWVAEIGPDGTLSEFRDTGVAGNIRGVAEAPDGGLFVLTADRGLLLVEEDQLGWTESSALELPGPALRMAAHGDRAIVALGSQGALLVEIDGSELRALHRFEPWLVVTAAAVRDDAAVLVGAGGIFLYDLRAGTPRLAGYADERYLPMDVVFDGDTLMVSDWGVLRRLPFDLDGIPVGIQAARGSYLRRGEPTTLVVRNPGDVEVTFTIVEGSTEYRVAPGGTARLDLSASEVAALGQGFYYRWEAGEHRGDRIQHIVTRAEPTTPALPPPTGGVMPAVTVLDERGAQHPIAPAGERVRISFFTTDCAAMWPLLQDSAWLAVRGFLDDGATLQLMPANGVEQARAFAATWLPVEVRYRFAGAPELNPSFMEAGDGPVQFAEAFAMPIGDLQCTDPTDYLVRRDGTVESAEREYFGTYHFR